MNWLNKRIVSQYGLICKVLDQKEENDDIILTCLAEYKDTIWEWSSKTVYLITKNNEILDILSGKVCGKIEKSLETKRDKWILYSEDEVKSLSTEQISSECE